MADECRSYTLGEPICRDGFPVSAACAGYRCHGCGSWAAEHTMPACMREDLGPQWLDDAGRPRLRRVAREAARG